MLLMENMVNDLSKKTKLMFVFFVWKKQVPVDEPCVALKMVGEITKSPQL